MYYFDWTWLILIPGLIITIWAQIKLSSTYSKYKKIPNMYQATGGEVARTILNANGLTNVMVYEVGGKLTDHYHPTSKCVNLSTEIYNGRSIAAMAVAAHECGHAIQDAKEYTPLRVRGALVPIVNFASSLSWILLFIGVFFSFEALVTIGILFFSSAVIFQLVTLPVEFNASSRALSQLNTLGLVDQNQNKGARKVLTAAALTYVAGALVAILQLLRLILIFGRNRD